MAGGAAPQQRLGLTNTPCRATACRPRAAPAPRLPIHSGKEQSEQQAIKNVAFNGLQISHHSHTHTRARVARHTHTHTHITNTTTQASMQLLNVHKAGAQQPAAPVPNWQPGGGLSSAERFHVAPPSADRAMLTALPSLASSVPSRYNNPAAGQSTGRRAQHSWATGHTVVEACRQRRAAAHTSRGLSL